MATSRSTMPSGGHPNFQVDYIFVGCPEQLFDLLPALDKDVRRPMETADPRGHELLNSLKCSNIEVSEVADDQITLAYFVQQLQAESAVLFAGFCFAAVDELTANKIHDKIKFCSRRLAEALLLETPR